MMVANVTTPRHVAQRWGMTPDEYDDFVLEYGNGDVQSSPMTKYSAQRRGARSRGIEWQFCFKSWWKVWQDSGRWMERGGAAGYVMARRGDVGPYSEGNVYICRNVINVKDGFVNRLDGIAGFRYRPGRNGTRPRPYCVYWKQKCVGSFATQAEAREAFLNARKK